MPIEKNVSAMQSEAIFSYSFTDGVHHLSPLQSSGAAIKAMLDHMDRVLLDWPVEQKVRVMADFKGIGVPPTRESIPYLLAFLRRKTRNPHQQARLAYIYSQAAQGRVLRSFLVVQRFLPLRVTVRFFSESEKDQALEWLHAG